MYFETKNCDCIISGENGAMSVFLHVQSREASVNIITYSYYMAWCSILLKNYCIKNAIWKKLLFEELSKHVKISYTKLNIHGFGVNRFHPRKFVDLSHTQMWQICRLTFPHVWKDALSLNRILFIKSALKVWLISSAHIAALSG